VNGSGHVSQPPVASPVAAAERPLAASRRRLAAIEIAVAAGAFVLALIPSAILLVNPDITEPLEDFRYPGVFLVNLISTATLFFPVPGITTAANVLIVTEASDSQFPWLVGLAGGAGMAIGELTAYYAGVLGAHLSRSWELPVPARVEQWLERAFGMAQRLMHRWGMLTLFVLAAIPDPVFEIAAVTAGSAGMPLRRYMLAVLAGCLVRGLTLAYLGTQLPFLT